MLARLSLASRRAVALALVGAAALLAVPHARAYINQADGTVLPDADQTASCEGSTKRRLQCCLDGPYGEDVDRAVDSVVDARIQPEAYRPVEDPPGSGAFPVDFAVIGEGAGFRNRFGWFYADEDPTDPANLHMVFDCRTGGTCDCPCNPNDMRPDDGSPQAWRRTIDFGARADFTAGRAIGFWIRTPERLDGSRDNAELCDNPLSGSQDHRTYFTSKALNDDGDYVHFLVYRSIERTDTFYFGFEDLFRGGDNDFEDVLVRVGGLVPLCEPQLETCNGVDDDCDISIDEGLTRGCSTACGSGTETCTDGSWGACSAPTSSAETCNGLDDDCDGTVDEGLTRACTNECGSGTEVCVAGSFVDCNAPTPGIESCNGADDDCDGDVDEGITRACYTACGSGTETCTDGAFGGCTAPAPTEESCNGLDDDCDGLTDEGITRDCSTACGSGTETCISGSFVGCTAPDPGLEACNGADDDCDGEVDEDLTRTCSTSCGTGTETCNEGVWEGCDAPTPEPEVCNNLDDDCNGVIDDGNPGGGAACLPDDMGGFETLDGGVPDGGAGEVCAPGELRCVAGELTCVGASSPTREICNCEDDDCDGLVDEGADEELCPGGGQCIDCRCASPCIEDEFGVRCPPGRTCDTSFADPEAGIPGLCVPGACAGVECTDEESCDPETGECVDLCEGVECGDGEACVRGRCVEDNCYGRGCPAGEICRMGECAADPCAEVSCEVGSFCRDGECVSVCDVDCPGSEVCRDGECVPAPCDGECRSNESCVDGACVVDSCDPLCRDGRICRGEACVDDPCSFVDCPEGYACGADGQCLAQAPTPPEAGPERGLATGGGGCSCEVPGRGGTPDAGGALLGALALLGLLLRRRRRPGRPRARSASAAGRLARLAPAVLLALLPLLGGCEDDPYCFEGCDDGGTDAGPADAGEPDVGPADGCVPTGEERCNDVDDDCDGMVDEDFDLASDTSNCGACGNECVLPSAFSACVEGECAVERCEIGFQDLNGNPTDGCEYACLESGDEICDERDNDCDGSVDEDFDLSTDLANCGRCGNVCTFANASASCEGSSCVLGECNAGFVDLDGDPGNGCELRCTATGDESCNGVDDDCDGAVDEGFDLSTDVDNCGTCGRACSFPNATEQCVDGVCGIASCDAGFVDVDGDPTTGCEIACTPTGDPVDDCDGVDDDCDGAVDEDDPDVGTSCGVGTGACEPGTYSCQSGSLVCVGGRGPTPETCNGEDDDCDGETDESTATEPIPGVGERCGETNEGACAFGSVVCTDGSLECGGDYVGPSTETCNGVDDDCDGAVDDSPAPPSTTPPSCVLTEGVCAGRTPRCNGASGWECDFPDSYQTDETICDGLDNDCDGSPDEGCLSPGPTGGDLRVDRGDTAGASNSIEPVVSGDGASRVYAAWMDLRDGGNAHVLFNRSTDGGGSWGGSPATVDESSGPAIGPAFGVTGASRQDVTLVWADFRGGSSYREIYTATSTDFGGVFGGDQRINVGQNTDSFNVDVATSGSNVYAVYESFTSSRSRHVFFVRSTDGGQSWDTHLRVDNGSGASFVAATPKVAAAGGTVYVVWRDNRNGALDIFLNRSVDGGATFGASDVRLDVGTTAGSSSSFSPSIAAEGANVYVAWVDDRSGDSFDIWLNRSNDAGASWLVADAIELDDDPLPHDSVAPRVVAPAAGRAAVGFVDYRFGFPDPFVVRSTDGGASWESPVRLDTGTDAGTAGSFDLALGGAGELLVAVWADDRDGFLDVYANYSLDGGAEWQPSDVRLDSSSAGMSDSQRPVVYVAPGVAHVLWEDHRDGANADIYYRRLE